MIGRILPQAERSGPAIRLHTLRETYGIPPGSPTDQEAHAVSVINEFGTPRCMNPRRREGMELLR